jgi:enoyl-CoA hydratase/carnithine racemase
VHGSCFGGGLQIALGADMRYVHPDAQLSVMEIKWGLVPDMALSKTLLDLIPMDLAKELTFSGRILSGEEAVALGLATRVVDDPVDEAMQMAELIAGKSPDAIRAGKQLLDSAGALLVADAFLLETELQVRLIGSANNMETVQANMMKRPPNFTDPD